MNKHTVLLAILSPFSGLISSEDMVIHQDHLMASSKHNRVAFGKKGFTVNGNQVKEYDLDPTLRYITSKQELKDLFSRKNCSKRNVAKKLYVYREGNDYGLRTHDTLGGSGPWLGMFLYGLTKAVGYGIVGAVVNKAAKTVTDGASNKASKYIPQPELNTMVTGFNQIGTVGPLVATQSPGPAIVTNWIDNNAQTRPEFYNAVTNGGAVAMAEVAATGGCANSFIEGIALAVAAWGTSLPTP